MGEVDVLNPDRRESTYNLIEPLRDQLNRFITTLEPYPEALQGTEMIEEKKTEVQVDLTTSITVPDQIDPKLNKQEDDKDGTGICYNWSQVDQKTLIE